MSKPGYPLHDKVALITGAAKRIGAEIARTLHADGAFIVIHYGQSQTEAQALSDSLNRIRPNSSMLYQADLGDVSAIEVMVDAIVSFTGGLDILVNNASGFYPTPLGQIKESDWLSLFDSNLKGPLFLSQAVAPHLMQRSGCIVNMVDVHAQRPLHQHSVYCAAKAGLVMLTKSLAQELGPAVRVNAIAPGIILWPEAMGNKEQNNKNELVERTSLKREGDPQEIARAVSFLVKDAAYITGQVLTVDGGRTLFQ